MIRSESQCGKAHGHISGIRESRNRQRLKTPIKDGAYFYYCVNVLRISRYSGLLWVVPTNTEIFCAV